MNRMLWVLALIALGGCQTHLAPARYSPRFQGFTDTNGHTALIPSQCLAPATEDEFDLGADYQPKLAPGCANNLVLLQMVERRQDLQQGRATGPTMAAPVGRAAQVYIDGYDREELRRRLKEQQAAAKRQEGVE